MEVEKRRIKVVSPSFHWRIQGPLAELWSPFFPGNFHPNNVECGHKTPLFNVIKLEGGTPRFNAAYPMFR